MIRRLLFLVVLLGVAFSVASVGASSSSQSASSSLGVIRLHSATIHTAEVSEYHNDESLSSTHRDSTDDVNQYQYIFHYSEDYDRSAIESLLGFRLRRYLPDNAWHVFTTPKKIAEIRQQRGIQWVGAYHADYKYHMNILGKNPHKRSRRSINELFYDHFLSLNDTTNAKKMRLQSSYSKEFNENIHDIHAVLPMYHESNDYVNRVAERLSATVKQIDSSLHSRIELFAVSGDTIVGHTNSEEDVQLLSKILSTDHEIFYITRRPVFYLHNKWARGITQTGNNNPNYDTNTGALTFTRPLRGEGQVVGVADSGLDWQSCFFHDNAFPNGPVITPVTDATVEVITPASVEGMHRKIVQYIAYVDGVDDNGHGTHVCGSIAGKASRDISFSSANGMAHEAKLAFFDIGRGTGGSLKVPQHYERSIFPWAKQAGAFIHSNSWGSTDPSYTQDASWVDDYMHKNQEFLILYAAGNDGYEDSSVGSPATAKNALTVGATANSLLAWQGIFCAGGFIPRPNICNILEQASSGDLGNGKKNSEVAYNDNHVAGFSSNGPTKDGRNKPDVVAPGLFILSAKNGQSSATSCTNGPGTLLNFQAGTSMATPITAGNVALIRQWFTDGYYPSGLKRDTDAFSPSSALLKAIVLAGSRVMTGNVDSNAFLFSPNTVTLPIPIGPPPNKVQGYGRIEVDQTIYFAGDSHRAIILGMDKKGESPVFIRTGDSKDYQFCVVDSTTQLVRVALVWTDPAGTPNAQIALVNDLDLVVNTGSTTILGNQLQGANTGTVDRLNPQELVTLPTVAPSTTVNVKVTAFKLPQGPQAYSLVVLGNVRKGACSGSGSQDPDTEVFQWQSSEWSKCDAMCKQSTTSRTPQQTRTVTCISSLKGKVDESICADPKNNAGLTKPPTTRDCNTILCGQVEYEWTLGSWSGCTEPCTSATKSGTQTRTVQCKTINVVWDAAQNEQKCSDHVKPPTLQKCNTNPCDGSGTSSSNGLRWVASNCTSTCSSSCTCTRTVKCYLGDVAISDSICTPENGAPRKPPSVGFCSGGQCKTTQSSLYQWRASEWGPCSVGCNAVGVNGGGVQTRLVRCWSALGYYDDEANCAGLEKPPTTSECNKDPCPLDGNEKGASNLEWLIGGWGRCDNETKTQKRWIVCANTNGRHDDAAKCEAHVGPQPATTRKCTPIPFDSASWKYRDERQSYVWYLQDDRWSDPAKWCGNPGGKIYRYAWCVGLDGKVADTRSRCAGLPKPAEERECFNCGQPCAAVNSWYPGEYWMGCTTVDPCCGTEHRHVFCADSDGVRQSDTSSCTGTPPSTTQDKCSQCPPNAKCTDYPNGINGNTADGPALPGSGVKNAPIMPPNGPAPTTSSAMSMSSPSLMIVMMVASFIRLFW